MAQGASVGVQRAMGVAAPRYRTEIAPCPICKSVLEFDTDGIGRTVETCTNRRCANAIGHAPTYNPGDLRPERTKKQRARPASKLSKPLT